MFAKALTLTAALAIAFTPGCRRKPKEPITPLPSARTGQQGITNPRPGLPGDQSGTDAGRGLTDNSGRPIGSDLGAGGQNGANGIKPGENIGLDGGPHDRSAFSEDRAKFAANVIYFDFDSAVIKTSEKSKLSGVAEHLKSNPNLAVEIEGHCDVRGSTEYNLQLGERRARAVQKYLTTQGVKPEQLEVISYGEERLVDLGANDEAHQKNRRAELKKAP